MSKILQFVEKAKEYPDNISDEINFGSVSNYQAQTIAASTGVVVRTGMKILSNYAVNHTFKRHSVENEHREGRGQVGIIDSDFELLPDILNNPDQIVRGTDGSRGKKALKFSKKYSKGIYTAVITVVPGKNGIRLEFNTMYIK